MKFSDKLRALREAEGKRRGLDRALTQAELSETLATEQGRGLSQSYLSQLESGARPHLTHGTRALLARFFQVHPGYLVDDPDGYHPQPMGEVYLDEHRLDTWLLAGAHRFHRDAELARALEALARHHDTRSCLLALQALVEGRLSLPKAAQQLRLQKAADSAPPADVCSVSPTLPLHHAAGTGDGQ